MSYSRWNYFIINDKPIAPPAVSYENQTNLNDDNLPSELLDSRSDYFGRVIKYLIEEFNDISDLAFLAYGNGDNGSDPELVEKTTRVFDKENQFNVIKKIDIVFSHLKQMDSEGLEYIFEDDIDVDECLKEADKILDTYKLFDDSQEYDWEREQYYAWTGSDNDHADGFFQSILLIQRIFNYALEKNLFVIYKTFTE